MNGTVLIVYASRYGQTEKIARRCADVIRAEGVFVDVVSIATMPAGFPLEAYESVIVAAPVMYGKHPREIERFIIASRSSFARMRTSLISVSNAAKGNPMLAESYVHTIVERTGWLPDTFATIAGAQAFSRYGWFTRWMVLRAARKAGERVDPSRDTELTNWEDVDNFAREFVMPLTRRFALVT